MQTIQDLSNQEFSNVRILTDFQDYDINNDTRLLIPFSYYQHFGLMNQNGEVVVEPKFDRILDSCRFTSDVIRVGVIYVYGFNGNAEPYVYHRMKWGLLNSKGEVILETAYKGIGLSDDGAILTLNHLNGQYEVVSVKGESIVTKGKYHWIDSFDSGMARVNIEKDGNKRWGIIDFRGREVLPLIYSNIWNFYKKNREWVTIESIDEHGDKRVGKFNLNTRKVEI